MKLKQKLIAAMIAAMVTTAIPVVTLAASTNTMTAPVIPVEEVLKEGKVKHKIQIKFTGARGEQETFYLTLENAKWDRAELAQEFGVTANDNINTIEISLPDGNLKDGQAFLMNQANNSEEPISITNGKIEFENDYTIKLTLPTVNKDNIMKFPIVAKEVLGEARIKVETKNSSSTVSEGEYVISAWPSFVTETIIENDKLKGRLLKEFNYELYALETNNSTIVKLPKYITKIEAGVFRDCFDITEIDFSEATELTDIGGIEDESGVFQGCVKLESVKIPATIETIGQNAFKDCYSLAQITFDGDTVKTIGKNAFSNCAITELELPTVTDMGEYAFSNCWGLTKVELKGSTAKIADNTFLKNGIDLLEEETQKAYSDNKLTPPAKIEALTTVILPESITSIGKNAFWPYDNSLNGENKDAIESALKGKGDSTIAAAQIDDKNAVNVYYPGKTWDSAVYTTYTDAPTNTYHYVEITGVSDATSVIKAITDADKAAETTANEEIEGSGKLIFKTDINDKLYVNVAAESKAISDIVSAAQKALTDSTLSYVNGVITVGIKEEPEEPEPTTPEPTTPEPTTPEAPSDETIVTVKDENGNIVTVNKESGEITDIVVSDEGVVIIPAEVDGVSVISIGAIAEENKDAITEVQLPDTIEQIKENAFAGCNNLTEVTIPKDAPITEIKPGTFEDCVALKKVELSDQITKIGENAFAGCHRLSEIEIPTSVRRISRSAFQNCSGLRKIKLGRGARPNQMIPRPSFSRNIQLLSERILGSRTLFASEDDATMDITSQIQTIEANAFTGSMLKEVDFGGTIEELKAIAIEDPNVELKKASIQCDDGVIVLESDSHEPSTDTPSTDTPSNPPSTDTPSNLPSNPSSTTVLKNSNSSKLSNKYSRSSISTKVTSGGKVKLNTGYTTKGSPVKFTVKPDKGYEVGEVKVVDSNGTTIKVSKKDTIYSFLMPVNDITIEVTFVAK